MDRFEAMTIFLAVVEAGSLTGAGRKLGVPLPTISRKISDLEEHLNTRLLIRSTRQLDLTEAGRAYVAASKRILEDVASAERAAAGEYSAPRGELILTAPVMFGRLHVLPVVTEFLKTYPDIDVTFVLSDRNLHLQQDHIDLALRIGTLPDSSMRALKVGSIRRILCASPDYLAARGTPARIEDLAEHSCITFTGNLSLPDSWSFGSGGAVRPVQVRSRLVVNTAAAAVDAAVAGLGITRVMCYQTNAARRAGQLQEILRDLEAQDLPVSLVYSAQGILPQKLRVFLDFAAPRLRHALLEAAG